MIAVLFGFIVITSTTFFVLSRMAGKPKEVNVKRGLTAASIVGVLYVIIVGFIANG